MNATSYKKYIDSVILPRLEQSERLSSIARYADCFAKAVKQSITVSYACRNTSSDYYPMDATLTVHAGLRNGSPGKYATSLANLKRDIFLDLYPTVESVVRTLPLTEPKLGKFGKENLPQLAKTGGGCSYGKHAVGCVGVQSEYNDLLAFLVMLQAEYGVVLNKLRIPLKQKSDCTVSKVLKSLPERSTAHEYFKPGIPQDQIYAYDHQRDCRVDFFYLPNYESFAQQGGLELVLCIPYEDKKELYKVQAELAAQAFGSETFVSVEQGFMGIDAHGWNKKKKVPIHLLFCRPESPVVSQGDDTFPGVIH